MYYHFSIILLLYPFTKSNFDESKIRPLEICTDAADAIVNLVLSYEKLYGLRRTPNFLPYIVVTAGVTHLTAARPADHVSNSPAGVIQEIGILEKMSVCHNMAKRGAQILESMARNPEAVGQTENTSAGVDGDVSQPSIALKIFS